MTKLAVTKLVVLACAMIPASGQRNSPAAGPNDILCPVAEVKTEITTQLPKPWWNTPQLGKLHSLGVQVTAGEKTLVCRYSAYGTEVGVIRKFPDGVRDCKAVDKHFECH